MPPRMRFLPILLATGCVATISKPDDHAVVAAQPQMPALIRGWLDAAAAGTDCPMSLTEAREARAAAQKLHGDTAFVLGHVACMCDVVDKRYRLEYDGARGVGCGDFAPPLGAGMGVAGRSAGSPAGRARWHAGVEYA